MGRRTTGSIWGWAALGLPLILLLLIPVVALAGHAVPGEVWQQIRGEETLPAVWVSLRTTLVSLPILVVFGTPLAFGLAFSRGRIIEALLSLPAILPPSVAGIALLLAFGRMGLLGPALEKVGIGLPFTAGAVVFAQLFVSAPFYLRPAISAFRSLDPSLLEAAALDGARPFRLFSGVALPLVRRELGSASTLAWSRALGEFGATILFAGNALGVTRTMPLAIYLGYESDLSQAVALSVVLLIVALVVLAGGLFINRSVPKVTNT